MAGLPTEPLAALWSVSRPSHFHDRRSPRFGVVAVVTGDLRSSLPRGVVRRPRHNGDRVTAVRGAMASLLASVLANGDCTTILSFGTGG